MIEGRRVSHNVFLVFYMMSPAPEMFGGIEQPVFAALPFKK